MIEILKELIVDYQQMSLETGFPRRLKITPMTGKAAVCIGVRRCGKSTLLFQIIRRLREGGLSSKNILYLNFFDDRLHGLRQGGLGSIMEAYFSLYPEKKQTEKIYCFFDEIQAVPDWEPFVDRLLRTENCEVYLSGSSARMLSREIATQMRGRALSWELFPFSFREFLDSRNLNSDAPLSSRTRFLVQKAFDDYWASGGFPETLGIESHLRVKIHQEYLSAILFRDLIERHNVSHPRAVVDLAHWLMNNAASLYSINSLTGYLKSLGHKAPKSAVSEYLQWFEDAYFLFTVRLFDPSLARAHANPKKIYCIDHALAASVASGILLNSGHLLENLVFAALRRITPDLYYYRTRSGREVDFIARARDQSIQLIQVCEFMSDPQTRKREITALREAMAEQRTDSATIVTRNEEERIQTESGVVDVVPAWRFLMSLPDDL